MSLSDCAIRRLPFQDFEGVAMVGQLNNRILLVEDDSLIRKLISRYLVAAGYVVQTAVDGLDALGKLRAVLPHLIISDLKMPRMSGVELLNIIRKRFPQVPVIAITAASDEIPEGVAADAYYNKSGSGFERLMQTISELTNKSPSRTASPPVGNEPVQARWDGEGHFVLRCEDCLREFSVPGIFPLGRDETCTTCVHCGKFVRFLVTQELRAT
jgi:CheY-like chemotaxis protein